MAVDNDPVVSINDDRLVIEHLEITDEEVLEFIDTHDDHPPADLIRLAVRAGFATLRLSNTSAEVEFVRREFDKINQEFQDEIETLRDDLDDWFDAEDGDFAQLIEHTFGKDGEVIDDVFDHNDEDTPLGELYSDLEDKLQMLREDILEKEAKAEVKQRTPIKGEIFEDDLQTLLGDITRGTDEVERTGYDYGQRTDRFVGDFVITLSETGQEIVLEAKDVTTLNKPDIKRELEEGIKNRGADYGMLILKNEDAASDFLGAFREFDQRMLYVAISSKDTDTYDRRLLNLAYEWARMRTLSEQFDPGEGFDAEAIQSKIAEAEDAIAQFRDIRTQCSNIEDARQRIEQRLDTIQDDIEEQLMAIDAELSTT